MKNHSNALVRRCENIAFLNRNGLAQIFFFCKSIGIGLFVSSDTCKGKAAHTWISPPHWELVVVVLNHSGLNGKPKKTWGGQ